MKGESAFFFPSANSIKDGISLITAVMNRPENLEQALKNWVTFNIIDEIIIVDWSSDTSLHSIVEKYQDGRIHIAVVAGQKKWILSIAFNLAARLASRSIILKMDADVKLSSGFFTKHKLVPGIFFSGNWLNHRNINELHLNGILFLFRSDFFKVNGYNEYIRTYGWDDNDLYQRLTNNRLTKIDLDNDTLEHIEHSGRLNNQLKPSNLSPLPDEEFALLSTLTNRFLTETIYKWSTENVMQDFSINKDSENLLSVKLMPGIDRTIDPEIFLEALYLSMKERLLLSKAPFDKYELDLIKPEQLVEVYLNYFVIQP